MKRSLKLLCIDTSTAYLTVALMDGEKALSRFHKEVGRNHSDLLMPTIAKVLKRCALRPGDLDGFCVGIGPGSFTGLRIGITAVKGLSYVLKKPVVAVPTLDAIAANVRNFSGTICPVLDARKNKLYACLYNSDGKATKRASKYLLLAASDLVRKLRGKNIFLLGDGLDILERAGFSTKNTSENWYPRADVIGRLGLEGFRKKKFIDSGELEPLYLYSKECDMTGR